jgi:hypothetical protein
MRLLLISVVAAFPLMAQDQAAPAQQAPAQQAPAQAAAPAAPASPAPTDENWLTGFVDFGYRWVGTSGSFNTYRSIVDLGSGPKLLSTEFTITDPKHRLFDRIDVRAYNIGDDPYETFHLDAMKKKLYNFSADYRNIAYYSNLPAFADPLLGNGIMLNEQSLDTRSHIGSFELELFPNARFVPYLAYDHDSNWGTGVATFVSQNNEYPVVSRPSYAGENYRAGVRVEMSRIHGTIEEGGTTFKDIETLAMGSGTNYGNSNVPFLGQTLDLTSLSQAYGVSGHSIYTKALINANLSPWFDLYGQFLFSQPQSSVHYQQTDTGSQVLLSSILFYTGEQSVITSLSKAPHTSASLGGEIRPFRRLRFVSNWLTDRMHSDGSSAVKDSLTGGSIPLNTQATFPALLNSALAVDYSQIESNLIFDLSSTVTFRGGYRYTWGDDINVILPIAELAGLEQGRLRRNVGVFGATWRPIPRLSITGDLEVGASTGDYYRTSLYDYHKGRIRARYQASPSLSIQANVNVLSNQNPTVGVNYNFISRQESLSFLYAPAAGKKLWNFEGSYTHNDMHSDIKFLDPEFLIPEVSRYFDYSHTASGFFNANLPAGRGLKAKFSLGGSLFISSGSNPTRFYQPTARLSVPLHKNVAWEAEWRYDGFNEIFYGYQTFGSEMFITSLRLSR